MDKERLQEIKSRLEKTTPGEWIVDEQFRILHVWDEHYCEYVSDNWDKDNAEFIAHARQDVPDLVAEIEQLRAENARFRAVLETFASPTFWENWTSGYWEIDGIYVDPEELARNVLKTGETK